MHEPPKEIWLRIVYDNMVKPWIRSYPQNITIKELKDGLCQELHFDSSKYLLMSTNPQRLIKYLIDQEKMLGQFAPERKLEIYVHQICYRDPTQINQVKQQKDRSHQDYIKLLKINGKERQGLVLHGDCKNKNCQLYNRQSIIILGFGNFNISKQGCILRCPKCHSRGKAKNMGFYKCKVKIEGQKQNGEEIMINFVVEGERYKLFKEDGTDDFRNYAFIEAKIQKL